MAQYITKCSKCAHTVNDGPRLIELSCAHNKLAEFIGTVIKLLNRNQLTWGPLG